MNCIYKSVENSMTENEIRYEVYYDEDDFFHSFESTSAIEFESEEDKQAYRQRFINEELFAFGVSAFKLCKCCNAWSEKNSVWGIHAESPQEALALYQNDYGVESISCN